MSRRDSQAPHNRRPGRSSVHQLPDGAACRARQNMHTMFATAVAIAILVFVARFGELSLAASAILLLGMALNELRHRGGSPG